MRILVYGLAADKLGGIETFLLNMNEHMSNDCVFDYIVEGDNCIHKDAIERKGGQIYFMPLKRSLFQNILAWLFLLKQKKETYKVVYFNMFSLSYALPIFFCQLYGYKVIVHSHCSNLHDCGVPLKGLHFLSKQLLKLFNVKRLTNSSLSSTFMFGNPSAGEIIYNGIDVERFKFNAEDRDRIRRHYSLDNKTVFGFAGRISYEKNPFFIIDIFNEILKTHKNSVLMIAGDGDLLTDVKAQVKKYGIQDSVLLLGTCTNIEELYQAMDVFILPSRFEGLGIVLIEAQTAGLPCLTSAEVVPPEARATELLDYVPLQNNPEEWAKRALHKLDPDSKNRLHGYEIIQDGNFNITREALRLERILRDYVQDVH